MLGGTCGLSSDRNYLPSGTCGQGGISDEFRAFWGALIYQCPRPKPHFSQKTREMGHARRNGACASASDGSEILAPLVRTRGFGMTPARIHPGRGKIRLGNVYEKSFRSSAGASAAFL